MNHNHSQGFAFAHFDITQKRGGELYCMFVAHMLHNALCDSCGEHIVPAKAIKYMREELIPEMLTHSKNTKTRDTKELITGMSNHRNERDFMYFQAGQLFTPEYDGFWLYATKHYKKDTYENTFLALLEDSKKYFQQFNSPLN